VLELDQMQGVLPKESGVDLVPAAVGVTELEVRPYAVRGLLRDSVAEVLESLALMVELGLGYFDPAIVRHRPLRLVLLATCRARSTIIVALVDRMSQAAER
jgi:hypothetical protein